MPSVNSLIAQADYNSIRNKIIAVLGNGSINRGYGQQAAIQSAAVSVSSRVSINDWANLRFDIINAYKHINGINPITAQVVEGNTIRYTNSFTPDTGTLDVPQLQYDTWANTIDASRFTIAAGESGTTAVVSSSRTASWTSECTCIIQFNWSNADQARYWFNSGGRIRVSASRTGGAGTAQNTNWSGLLSSAGTISFGGAVPAVNTTPSDGTNWYRTSNAFQSYSTSTGTSAYTSNQYVLESRCVDATNNSLGTAAQGEIRVRFRDLYTDPGINPPDDIVDGTLTVSISTLFAAPTSMVPGTSVFTVVQPTVILGAITGS